MNVYIESLLNGLMVYWDEEIYAARYYVHLLIGDRHKYMDNEWGMQKIKYKDETFNEIAVVEVERNIKYYSFTNLGKIDLTERTSNQWGQRVSTDTGKNYYVFVEAEDKNGNIIKKSEKVVGIVYTMTGGYFSHSK